MVNSSDEKIQLLKKLYFFIISVNYIESANLNSSHFELSVRFYSGKYKDPFKKQRIINNLLFAL